LNTYAYVGALSNAEAYGYYPPNYDFAEPDEDDGSVSYGIEGCWVEYDAENHDMLKPGGGKWFE
jgi:hypothetical protein